MVQAFDDCTTLSSTFKLLESFEGLLERDAIAAEVAKKHKDMVAAFASDVKEVHELFLANRAFPVLSKNSPPHSGAAEWHAGSKYSTGSKRSVRPLEQPAASSPCLHNVGLTCSHLNAYTLLVCMCRCCVLGAWPDGAPAGAHGQAAVYGGSAGASIVQSSAAQL